VKTLALLHSTVRKEEKLLMEAARKQKVRIKLMDIRKLRLDRATFPVDFDGALERSVSTVKGMYITAFLESLGIPVVNTLEVAKTCEDKFLTSLRLERACVPTPGFALAFDRDSALRAVEELGGFPVVLKPPKGSWGRLLAKVNDRDSLDAICEHKEILGTPPHKAFYIQEFIHKPGRDIRAFTADGEILCAIYRDSSHWITNTARGAASRNCRISAELRDICRRASAAVGNGLLAMDIFEAKGGLMINEVNHTMEFRNSEEPTGVSISGAVVDYCIRVMS
jgi:[lysine-biosynthesis-protein LysW]--L-2-aminoadipate ligase